MSQGEQNPAAVAPIDGDALRKFAASFATGVVVLTTRGSDGSPFGLTMTAISSVSLDPPLFMACVDKGSTSLPPLLETGAFALNILGRDQEAISNTFASKTADKFAGIGHKPGHIDMPLIDGAIATAEFRVVNTLEAGDHVIVVGEAVASAATDGAPLGYFRGSYVDIG